MKYMFKGCTSLIKLDISNFNTDKVTYANGMFCECSKLNELNITNFKTDNIKDMSIMF